MQQHEVREWGNNTPIELLASALSDLHLLVPWLESFQEEGVRPTMAFLPSKVTVKLMLLLSTQRSNLDAWSDCFTPVLAYVADSQLQKILQAAQALQEASQGSVVHLKQEARPITAAIVAELSDSCSAGLSQLRGITAMYRMSARPAPTRYSSITDDSRMFP